MGLYAAWRSYGGPTLYPMDKTAVSSDVLEIGFIYAAIIVFASFISIIPGIRGREVFFTIIRILLGVFITAGIMLANIGQEWEISHIHTKTAYRAGLKHEITADIGVKIGLRSVNITLKTDPVTVDFGRETEKIDYNERFTWSSDSWNLGRTGFGPFAGSFNRDFRDGQRKGLPYPILWIAEYFTIDGEGIRWGRHYLQAGFYAHICIWLSFPLWILALVTLQLVVRYGAYFMLMTGGVLILANILFASIRNANDLAIPFEDGTLTFSFGSSFYLCLITGVLCVGIGMATVILELFYKEHLATFLGIDVLQDFQEYYASGDELQTIGTVLPARHSALDVANGHGRQFAAPLTNKRASMSDVARRVADEMGANSSDDDDVYENPEIVRRMFRRKVGWATRGTIAERIGKSRKTKPRPNPALADIPDAEDGQGHYENAGFNDHTVRLNTAGGSSDVNGNHGDRTSVI